jgi:4a-hydroxytetrahydrobiopterin dehydratase
MSERGWHQFLGAEGLDDWVVLHGGATAVFCVPSVRGATRLAGALADVSGLAGSGVLLTISEGRLTVRLSRDMWQLEARHVELARVVSAVARAHGAVADRAAAQEVQLAISAQPDAVDVDFWRAALGYAAMADDNAVDPLGHGSTVWMQELDVAKPLRDADPPRRSPDVTSSRACQPPGDVVVVAGRVRRGASGTIVATGPMSTAQLASSQSCTATADLSVAYARATTRCTDVGSVGATVLAVS